MSDRKSRATRAVLITPQLEPEAAATRLWPRKACGGHAAIGLDAAVVLVQSAQLAGGGVGGRVSGHVYDVDTGLITTVVDSTRSRAAYRT